MARIIEPLIQETLWSELESRGFSVYGEVSLPDSGRIDLYVVTPNGQRWGIEVKNHWNMVAWGARDEDLGTEVPDPEDEIKPTEIRRLTEQLDRYAESGYCDSMYAATQGPKPLIRAIEDRDNWDEKWSLFFDKWGDREPPEYVGAIRTPPFAPGDVERRMLPRDFDRPCGIEIVRQPRALTDDRPSGTFPELPPCVEAAERGEGEPREFDIAHGVWKHLMEQTPGPVVREPVIPSKESRKPQQPDIMHFSGHASPFRIYHERQDKRYGFGGMETDDDEDDDGENPREQFKITATEVKPDLSNKENIAEQLKRYLDSGGLTELYLCLPLKYAEDGLHFLETRHDTLGDVGLLVYDGEEDEVQLARRPSDQDLEYPGLELSRNNHSVCQTGWGMAWLEKNQGLKPVWDQENLEGRYDGPDPTERDVSDLDWSDEALQAEEYDDPEENLTFVECTSCEAVAELDMSGRRCPECNRPLIRRITQMNVRKVGTDKYGNTVYTKVTE
ncbi:hypothetical protein HLRTI_003399 [Halorhabdus tiamatea SARL4B]|uniref:Uncharacterized protein n=1 Tax=Halorhabdus tiamatea SARL4B TaxID=1033806 RepID=F7PHG1_9EURY|nr:hypothetical protein [Halorhabdus tiamatea]ERJ04648.1 hypothetical protein HLRTI_003399 [Halorhabdus tiamatea SARL4B]CCQ35053.1 hypothetical protein HTIA_p2951 [Halorhabdus tiamatea SARL4B]